MKLLESSDGTIKVMELDPTKKYWLVLDDDCGIDPHTIRKKDGLILIKHAGSSLTLVENPEQIQVVARPEA